MRDTPGSFATRCLPMMMANQAGWLLHTTCDVRAVWNGNIGLGDLRVQCDGAPPYIVKSQFGIGILTFEIPILFRTPPGFDLWARGPANMPKRGTSPLEGIIETDWSIAPFTMNWQITEPDMEIHFERDEPFAMILPQPRGALEQWDPVELEIADDPTTHAEYEAWLGHFDGKPRRAGDFQGHYTRGQTPAGAEGDDHRRNLRIREFACEK